jgi:hypothetical protein
MTDTSLYPSPKTVATLPTALQFIFTPPTAEAKVKEKIRRALELRNSFYGKYRESGRFALAHGTHQQECNNYFCAYYRADRLWKELQHQL